ncbi:MAG: hypothetical protein P8I55_13175 [Crocinitomix sp.]|nr:hypothetical protein [Crocinitomix sp.]
MCLVISTLFSCSDDSNSEEVGQERTIIEEVIEGEEVEEDEKDDLFSSHLRDFRDGDYTLEFSLDTLQILAEMNLLDKVDRTDLMNTDSEKPLLSEKIDTFEMYSVTYGCICPNWNVVDCDNSGGDGYSGPCQYYIEPAHEDLEITIPYDQLNSHVRFIGKKYLKDAEDSDHGEGSHGGQEFKYYSFEFIRPYMVYGPLYNDTIFSENGVDTILETLPTYLTVD